MWLTKASKADFEVIYPAMQNSFIPDEIREKDAALTVLDEEDYTVYKIYENAEWVGFITLWELSGFAFIEHFAVFSEYRNRGYGGRTVEMVKEKYESLVLEAEPPIEEIQKRRIGFYERCGFCQNDYEYMQPSYREGGAEVRLVLMSYPAPLSDCEATKREIYSRVYKRS